MRHAHAEQLAALRRQQSESVFLNSLAKQVTDSGTVLRAAQRFERGERGDCSVKSWNCYKNKILRPPPPQKKKKCKLL